MSEQNPGRDEKGLTISGRTMLRILLEFARLLAASRKVGNKLTYEVLQTPTILVEIRALLWIASGMAKRLGSREEIEAYLAKHTEEDERIIRVGASEVEKTLMEEALIHGGVPKCPKCHEFTCPMCKECHSCEKRESHSSPFDFPSGGAAN
jgi:hypothetical protein